MRGVSGGLYKIFVVGGRVFGPVGVEQKCRFTLNPKPLDLEFYAFGGWGLRLHVQI